MAVHALHAFGEVNVLEMHRVLPLLRIVRGDHGVVEVEHVALFVLLENGAENPAVAVVIGELRLLQLRVQLGDFFEELKFAPQPARGGGLGIFLDRADEFGVGGILLFQKRLARFRAAEMRVVRERIFRMRIHELAVALLVPPRVTKIRIHEEIALVHVAIHALRARDRAGERVLDRVAALVFANRGIAAEAQALIAEFGIPTGVRRRAVVRVHDVARGAAARTVIARMIVAAHEVEERIVQAHLLQIQHDGIGAVQRAEAAFTEAARGFAGRFADGRDAELELLFTAALEDAEQVARLRDVPLRQRIEERQHAEFARVLGRDGRRRVEAQRLAAGSVGLAVTRGFEGHRAVVVERRAPEHRAVAHHRVADVARFFFVAGAAGFLRDAQVAGIHELHELGRLVIQQHARIARVRGAFPEDRIARGHVGFALQQAGRRIAAVTIGAAEHDVRGVVHRQLGVRGRGVLGRVALETAAALAHRVVARLVHEVAGFYFGGCGRGEVFAGNGNFGAEAGFLGARRKGEEKQGEQWEQGFEAERRNRKRERTRPAGRFGRPAQNVVSQF